MQRKSREGPNLFIEPKGPEGGEKTRSGSKGRGKRGGKRAGLILWREIARARRAKNGRKKVKKEQ